MTALNVAKYDNVKNLLLEYFDYSKDLGVLFWKKKPRNGIKVGDLAGSIGMDGYVAVLLKRNRLHVHRVIWFLHYGEMPMEELDHINHIKSDNRPSNLRLSTRSGNQRNREFKEGFGNVFGYFGVSSRKCGKFVARVYQGRNRHKYLGWYDCIHEAAMVSHMFEVGELD